MLKDLFYKLPNLRKSHKYKLSCIGKQDVSLLKDTF